MPGFLSEYDGTETLTFGSDGQWWVKVKKNLLRGEFRAAQTLLVKPVMRYIGTTAETKGDVDTVTYQDELAFHAIQGWNLTDRNGEILPLDPEAAKRASIASLPEEVFEKIVGVVRTGTKDDAPASAPDASGDGSLDPFRGSGEGSDDGQGASTSRTKRVSAGASVLIEPGSDT